MTPGPVLDGLRVIDLTTDVAGAWCARLLAGYGAEVVRLEPPVDRDRHRLVAFDAEGRSRGAWHRHLNAGKRSVRVDTRTAAGRAERDRLLRAADVVVVDADGGEPLPGRLPDQLHVVVTPLGMDSPIEGVVDPVLMAMSGWMAVQGESHGPPMAAGGEFVSAMAGTVAALGVLAALLVIDAGGPGQTVEVRAVDVAVASTMFDATGFASTGCIRPRRTNEPGQSWSVFEAQDGYVSVNSSAAREWVSLWSVVFGDRVPPAQLARDGMPLDREGIGVLGDLVASAQKRELMELAQLLGHLVAEVHTPSEVLGSPQLEHRGWFVPDGGEVAGLRRTGAPARIPTAPWSAGGPAPGDGAHSARWRTRWTDPSPLRAEARRARAKTADPGAEGTPSAPHALPLDGLRVVDLSAGWAGPLATELLADLGADVVKVESIGRTDWVRTARRFFTGPDDDVDVLWEKSPMFNGVNESKRGITLDLTDARGRSLLLELVATADVLVENFTPRVMRNLGLDDEVLRAAREDLIIVSMPGMGRTGPWRDFRATALVTEGVAGITSRCGEPGGPPQVVAMQHADPNAGFTAAMAVLLALRARRRGRGGCHVEVAQLEALVTQLGAELIATQLLGEDPPRRGNTVPGALLSGCVRTATGWLQLVVHTAGERDRLVELIGIPSGEAASPPSAEQVAHALRGLDGEDLAPRLRAAGIACAVVDDASRVPHTVPDAFHWNDRAHVGRLPYPSCPLRLSGTPARPRTPAPTLGQHNGAVLSGVLGLDVASLASLVADGVIGTVPRGAESVT